MMLLKKRQIFKICKLFSTYEEQTLDLSTEVYIICGVEKTENMTEVPVIQEWEKLPNPGKNMKRARKNKMKIVSASLK